ncbi:ABC transporter ATP-binding protein [Camelliibacillus cellulosilyticus]|uniref:ABC transporter ATP-binding protein n=1 Tax=Camelliibacillus cellulosilyticus TaxID=2174486 RepID=A0ABV9GR72_9BACL
MSVLNFLKPYRVTMAVAYFFMLLELAVELAQPMLIANIIDKGIMKKDLNEVFLWGAIMVVISIIAFLGALVGSFYASHTSQSFGYDVRVNVFKKIQAFSFANFNQFPTSSLITRMTNDITQIQNTVFMSMRIMLRAPLLVIFGTISALLVDAKLAFYLVIVIPALVLFLIWAMNKGGKLFRSVQERIDAVNAVMRENLTAIRLIKALLRAPYENKRFTASAEMLKKKTVSALRLMETTMPILLLIMNMSILGILWVGHLQIDTGTTQVGSVVAIVNYALRITGAFTPLSFIIMAFSRARASIQRISKVLDTEIDLKDAGEPMSTVHQPLKGKVTFQNVSFRYPETGSDVLHEMSFDIQPGETVAIMGATGSGKSTLFQLIPRLYDATSGTVCIDDTPIQKFKLDDLRKQIGFVPQEALLFTGSIQENISWGKNDATMDQIIAAAKSAQIHETIIKLPNGYNTKLGQKGVNLSGGQKQRLSIARALVRMPRILLLDDSTSALDLKTEAKLLQALKKYSCTTFIITQKVSTAMEADKILLLKDGTLIEQGAHRELLEISPLYQQIYESQFGKGLLKHA